MDFLEIIHSNFILYIIIMMKISMVDMVFLYFKKDPPRSMIYFYITKNHLEGYFIQNVWGEIWLDAIF